MAKTTRISTYGRRLVGLFDSLLEDSSRSGEVVELPDVCTETGRLDFVEAKVALRQLGPDASEDRLYMLLLYVIYAYNDRFFRSSEASEPSRRDREVFHKVCQAIMETSLIDDVFRAELLRETGEFEKCIALLDSLDVLLPCGEDEKYARSLMRQHALEGDSDVFRIYYPSIG